jgi:polyferredoxin
VGRITIFLRRKLKRKEKKLNEKEKIIHGEIKFPLIALFLRGSWTPPE